MKQVKRYVGRAAALALACFVVAFSVSVPAAALDVDNSLQSTLSLIAEVFYSDGTYDDVTFNSSRTVPFALNGTDSEGRQFNVDIGDVFTRARLNVDFIDIVNNQQYYIHLRFISAYWGFGSFNSPSVNLSISSASKNTNSWSQVPFTIISRNMYRSANGSYIYDDYVIAVTFPVDSVLRRIGWTNDVVTPQSHNSVGTVTLGLQICEFLSPNPVVDQSQSDRNEADRIDGSVNDKTQQSNQITNQIEQLQKPNVDSSSGKPVVGGMVVDPMQQVNRDSFNAYTNVLGTIFGSTTILGYFIIVFSLIFISYVIFGKSGG